MLINDIEARIGEIAAELEALAGLTDPTAEDMARAEELLAENEQLRKDKITAGERIQAIAEAHARAKAEGRDNAGSFQVMKKTDPYETDLRMLSEGELRDAARAVLDRPEANHLDGAAKTNAERLVNRHGTRMANYLLRTSRPAYRSAFAKYISGSEGLLTNEERMAVAETRTTLVLADANGGYAVPALLDPTVIYTGDGVANPIRQVARVVTGMDDTWRGVSSAGITASWDSESIQVSNDGPTFGQPTVVSHKASAFVPFTVEIEGDWSGLATEISTLFAIAKDELETTAFATGDDADQPVGILTALFAGSATTAVTVTTDGQFGAVDVRAAFGALGPRYRGNASWMMSIDVLNEIRAFGTDAGIANQTVDLTAPYAFPVLGKPAYENSGFPAFTGTTGAANLLVVGDFRHFVVFDRIGSRVEFIPHLMGANNRPSGERGLYFWWRTGSDSVNDAAFRLLVNT